MEPHLKLLDQMDFMPDFTNTSGTMSNSQFVKKLKDALIV